MSIVWTRQCKQKEQLHCYCQIYRVAAEGPFTLSDCTSENEFVSCWLYFYRLREVWANGYSNFFFSSDFSGEIAGKPCSIHWSEEKIACYTLWKIAQCEWAFKCTCPTMTNRNKGHAPIWNSRVCMCPSIITNDSHKLWVWVPCRIAQSVDRLTPDHRVGSSTPSAWNPK